MECRAFFIVLSPSLKAKAANYASEEPPWHIAAVGKDASFVAGDIRKIQWKCFE
jgi:hypothetical protein